MNIRDEVKVINDEIIKWRRDFHEYPELGFKEKRTSQTIYELLQSFGLSPIKGVAKTGVIADLKFGEGPIIALRADMDALPIQEKDNHSYSSKNNGVMHACGHDGHMAILLGAAKALSKTKNSLSGTVRFIFQPAEEGGGGARHMIEEGCLDGVSEIYGIHLWNYQPVGEVGVKDGPILAAADMFDITIKGTGGHGATPQGTVDTIVVSSQLVQAFQTIISRNTNPIDNAVITIGMINGGNNFNVIADEVKLIGTTRSYTNENRSMLKRRMKEIIEGVALTYGAKIEFNYRDGYPPTINYPEQVKKVINASKRVVGKGAGNPYLSMAAEDFSYYLQKVSGCFFFIGSAPDETKLLSTPHHCSHFDIDERALSVGASVYLNLVYDILG